MPLWSDPLEELIAELDRVAGSERTERGYTIMDFLQDLRVATDVYMRNRTPEEIEKAKRSNPASLRVDRYLKRLDAESASSGHSKQSRTTDVQGGDQRPRRRGSSKPRAKRADESASPTGRVRLVDP